MTMTWQARKSPKPVLHEMACAFTFSICVIIGIVLIVYPMLRGVVDAMLAAKMGGR